MPNVFATRSGLWSNTLVWNTSALPSSNDDVFANNFTVTIDISPQVLSINTTSAPGINAGGGFRINNSVSLSANVVAGTTTCLTFLSAAPNSCTVVGNVSGSSTTSSAVGINNNTTGTLTVRGNIFGGYNLVNNINSLHGVTNSGIINVFGNIYGGESVGATTRGLNNALSAFVAGNVYASIYERSGGGERHGGIGMLSNSVAIISGDVYAPNTIGSQRGGVNISDAVSNCRLIVNGNVYGSERPGSGLYVGGIFCRSTTSLITINGNVFGGNSSHSNGIWTTGGDIIINGNVYGGLRGNGIAAGNALLGNPDQNISIIVNGTVFASEFGPSGTIYVSNSGVMYARKAVGHDAGIGSSSPGGSFAIQNFTGTLFRPNSLIIVDELQCGARGAWPVFGSIFVSSLSSAIITMKNDRLQDVPFFLNNNVSGLVPVPADVRSGVVYNQGNSTGTLVLPDPSAVALGVPTDNTVGTTFLTPDAVWNTANNTLTATSLSGTIGFRLNNAATVQTVGHLIAAYNS